MPSPEASLVARTKSRGRRVYSVMGDIVAEHWAYRRQIFQLAWVDLLKTYRGAALGWLWAVIKPSVTIFVYWFAFSFGLRGAGKGEVSVNPPIVEYPFFLWLIAGIICWFYIQEMLTQGSTNFKRYDYLVTKIRFPVSTISTFVSISKLYVHLALLAIVAALFVAMGYPLTIYVLQLPFYIVLMFIFFTLWSMFASLLSAMSKDFANVVNSFVTAIFWMSGILWDVNRMAANHPTLTAILKFNPVTFFATGYRNAFVSHVWFWEDAWSLQAFGIVFVTMFVLAIYAYYRLRRDIADVL